MMNAKKLVLFSMIIFFSSIASSAPLCAVPTDTLFYKFTGGSDPTSNYHYSDVPVTGYEAVCFNDFFNGSYGGAPLGCDVNNWLFNISSVSHNNSHASIDPVPINSSIGNVYDLGICFGDLVCEIEDLSVGGNGGYDCSDPNKTVITRMSNESAGVYPLSNMHGADPSYQIGDAYPWKVCCRSASVPLGNGTNGTTSNVTNAEWRDADNSGGNIITHARVNQTVFAVLSGRTGPTPLMNVSQDNSPFGGPYNPLDPDDIVFLNNDTDQAIEPQTISLQWNITLDDILGFTDYDRFRFDVEGNTSPYLNISWCGDSTIDSLIWGETCDDGINNGVLCDNTNSSCNYCTTSCNEVTLPLASSMDLCGNFMLDSGEDCDYGSPGSGGQNGNSSFFNGTGQYCTLNCELRFPSNATWRDLEGNAISKAAEGQTVMLVLTDGENVTEDFEIWDRDPLFFFDDFIDSVGEIGYPITVGPVISPPDKVGTWTIPSEAILSSFTGTDDYEEIYFEIDSRTSDDLEIVYNNTDPVGDAPPNITLSSPLCGANTTTGSILDINFSVFDRSYLVSGNVKIDNVEIYTFNGIGGSHSVSHTFSIPGTSNIRVYAENSEGSKSSAYSNVLIVNESTTRAYSAACITEPQNFEFISEDYVFFNASTSRTLFHSTGSGGTYTEVPIGDMTFTWKFSDGGKNPYTSGNDSGSYLFYKYFGQYGENWADLAVIRY